MSNLVIFFSSFLGSIYYSYVFYKYSTFFRFSFQGKNLKIVYLLFLLAFEILLNFFLSFGLKFLSIQRYFTILIWETKILYALIVLNKNDKISQLIVIASFIITNDFLLLILLLSILFKIFKILKFIYLILFFAINLNQIFFYYPVRIYSFMDDFFEYGFLIKGSYSVYDEAKNNLQKTHGIL